MNHYNLALTAQPPTLGVFYTKKHVQALMLMYLSSPDFDLISKDGTTDVSASAILPFSLSNILSDDDYFQTLLYSTEFQNTVERFDKPIVEQGDIVAVVVPVTAVDQINQYFNEYVKFNISTHFENPATPGESIPCNILIGVSNSSKSEFNDPFNEALIKVISSPELFENPGMLNVATNNVSR